jgi:hypothetical protein
MSRSKFILIRFVLIVTLLLSPYALTRKLVQAAGLQNVKDTIEDSRPSTDANHTIVFTTPSGCPADDSPITVTFPAGFDLTSLIITDVDFNDGGGDATMAADCTGAEEIAWSISSQVMTFQICNGKGGQVAATSTVTIEIGDHASGGSNKIENQAAASAYDIDIDVDSSADTGTAVIAVVDTLTARVSVAEALSFTVGSVTEALCDDRPGDGTPTSLATTSGTLVDFGGVTTVQFYDACHLLTVGTNAGGGYVVTVTESDQLTYLANTIADGDCEGACSETSEAEWDNRVGNDGFGYCLDDITGDAAATADAGMTQCDDVATPLYKIFPALNDDVPEFETIMQSGGALTADDETHLGYRINVSGTQEAGTYENNIILVATPTY